MRLALAVLASVLATPALADAVTYMGTLDGRDILVELVEPSDGPVGGRFVYLDQGGDIPLDPAASPQGMIYLAEEAPCGETNCVPNEDNAVDMPPYAATWGLTIVDDKTLIGTRNAEGKKSKTADVILTEVGRRPLGTDEATPFGLHDASAILSFDLSRPLTEEDAPYEFFLVNYGYDTAASLQSEEGSRYLMAVDPRSKFAFPRLVSLSDGSDVSAMNATLAQLHGRMTLSAFDCLAFRYAAWGQSNNFFGLGGTLGDYDSEYVEVGYLSPRVMSWIVSGSTWCSGAHPYNHYNIYNYDVRTGLPIALEDIFSAWVAREFGAELDQVVDVEVARQSPDDYSWGPSTALIGYVRERLLADPEWKDDTERLEICASEQVLADQMTIRFSGDDRVTFVVSGAPHVMSFCNDDLFDVSIADLKDFLAPTAAEYFPSLAE